jgi:hypothetical protein
MERRKTLSILLMVFAIAMTAVLPALGKNQHRVKIFSDLVQGGTALAAGDYMVKWETHSPEATVTFLQKGKVMAELKGKVVEGQKTFRETMVHDGPTAN